MKGTETDKTGTEPVGDNTISRRDFLKAAAVAGATVGAGLLLAACNKTNVASIAAPPEEKPKDSTGDTGDQGDDNTDTTEPGPGTTTPEQGSTAEDFVPPLDKDAPSYSLADLPKGFSNSISGLSSDKDYYALSPSNELYYLDKDAKMWYKVPDDQWGMNPLNNQYFIHGSPDDPGLTK